MYKRQHTHTHTDLQVKTIFLASAVFFVFVDCLAPLLYALQLKSYGLERILQVSVKQHQELTNPDLALEVQRATKKGGGGGDLQRLRLLAMKVVTPTERKREK